MSDKLILASDSWTVEREKVTALYQYKASINLKMNV